MTRSEAVNPEWLREALVAGFDHEDVPYQEGTIATGMANIRRAAPGCPDLLPHQCMLKAYFIAGPTPRPKEPATSTIPAR